MKLLQICNVATITGGTGACGWTITRALPDWQHRVVFMSGKVSDWLQQAFGDVPLSVETAVRPQLFEDFDPDVILFHNTSENRMPGHIPETAIPLYYQHSGAANARGARKRCTLFFACSRHLARKAMIDQAFVLYQPVPRPAPMEQKRTDQFVVGRICTPIASKWVEHELLPLYAYLSERFNDRVRWEFVGCPGTMQHGIQSACRGNAWFYPAAWEARARMSYWSALLYQSSLEESYGRTVCEAQRAGCVPIVSRLGGFIEQIDNGQTGFLCETHRDFADGLQATLEYGDELRPRMIIAGDSRGGLQVWREKFLTWCQSCVAEAV